MISAIQDSKQPDMLPDYPTPPSSGSDTLSSAASNDGSNPGSPVGLDDSITNGLFQRLFLSCSTLVVELNVY